MLSFINHFSLKIQMAIFIGLISGSTAAHAQAVGGGGNNFGSIARNITESIEEVPGLITAVSYLIGLMLGTLGILKIKDHVENPTQTPMKDGAVRLAAGGALFGLPIVFESMLNTIGSTSNFVEPAQLNRVEFAVR